MEVGDLIKFHSGRIGRVIKIDSTPDTGNLRYYISTFPEDPSRDPFEENIVLSYNEFLPLSKDHEVVEYPNNYTYHRYGICTSCHAQRDVNVSTDKDEVECQSCMPGWVRLFRTEIQRDIHAVELKHNVSIVINSMREHNWKNERRK